MFAAICIELEAANSIPMFAALKSEQLPPPAPLYSLSAAYSALRLRRIHRAADIKS